MSIRAEFILKLYEDFKKVQVAGVTDEELRTLIEDITKFIREDLEDFESNQKVIGMNLFIVWTIIANVGKIEMKKFILK